MNAVESSSATAATPGSAPNGREFLAFKLGHEEYGIDILRVQEIRSFELPTRQPICPARSTCG